MLPLPAEGAPLVLARRCLVLASSSRTGPPALVRLLSRHDLLTLRNRVGEGKWTYQAGAHPVPPCRPSAALWTTTLQALRSALDRPPCPPLGCRGDLICVYE
ncbi:hypothetical protein KC19_VG291200 [Ceratodon purpureus]|uniref:Uncharacterized protein n=1 Tax=Ceratodon purpureus TaxID=3225 RepID=A0A8T0HVG8_CERPU|nr:hypothetical protein KC19_VG291200 [Ceratodon purpureus]